MSMPSEGYMLVITREYEAKLIELMGEREYLSFATGVAKKAYRAEVEAMADADFKKFCLENFDKITED